MADEAVSREQRIADSALRKVNSRLIPFLSLLYAFCIIDRTNVSYAALQMRGDLHFSDVVFGFGFGVFFIGYFLFEVPSNLIMERTGARRWIARIMISWGILSACMMLIKTPAQFCTLRFFLGIAEAGFYPGIVLYFTYWIPGQARARALARFLSMQAVFALASPILGGMLLNLTGKIGLRGWQWLFLVEGIPSVLLGVAVWLLLPDKPENAKWLTSEEKQWIVGKLNEDARMLDQVQHISMRNPFADKRILVLCIVFFATATGGNAVGFFAPQIIKSLSAGAWSDSRVSMSLIIPAIVGAIAMTLAAGHSDRTGNRRYHVAAGYLLAGVAFIVAAHAPTASLLVAALALNALGERIAAGSYWAATSNLMGVRAAAGGIALINSVGNLGGFVGPMLMGEIRKRSGGDFGPGLYMASALMIIGAAFALLLRRPRSNDIASADARVEVVVAAVEQQL